MESRKRQSHEWVAVAAREFTKIIRHLGLRSISEASIELCINYRTLKKLDERNPDPTLTLEKVMCIWHALETYAIVVQSPDRASEESRIIADSLMSIARGFPLNPMILDKDRTKRPRKAKKEGPRPLNSGTGD